MNRSTLALVGVLLSCGSPPPSFEQDVQALEFSRTATLEAEADGHVRLGATDSNFGLKDVFKVRRHNKNRGLVRFDADKVRASIGSGVLTSATIELTIANNPGNWGANGRDIALHVLTSEFTESGATWNCANDSNTLNSSTDCAFGDTWDLSTSGSEPWVEPELASATITTGLAGLVSLDVTAEIAGLLGGTSPHPGFILKLADESKKGHIVFSSRQSLDAPKLVLTFDSDEPDPPVPPVDELVGTTPVIADSYIKQNAADESFGDAIELNIRDFNNHRTVLRVDEADIATVLDGLPLAAAFLELTPVSATSWNSDRTIAIHRLTQDFAEAGVTWNCDNDTDPSNSMTDCAPIDSWDMTNGPPAWDQAALDTQLIANGQTTPIRFDVTSDVAAVLAGAPHHGWLLRKGDESSTGFAKFSSREGATPPQLVLYTTGCDAETDQEFCSRLGANCGLVSGTDDCGAPRDVDCGTCPTGTCGGGGQPNVCGCTPTTCSAEGRNCGTLDDGCGAVLDCGTCDDPESCGGAGDPGVCGCSATTCEAEGANCGAIENGCGLTLFCGTCPSPQTCGGGGLENTCGCTPTTCQAAGITCGSVSDGCGNVLNCGTCEPPTLAPIGDQSVNVGAALTIQLAATDPDGDPIIYNADPLPLPANAILSATGLFTFRPDATQVGAFELTFLASDGSATAQETITITVAPVDPNQVTTLSGQVIDTNDFVTGTITPVVGATVSLLDSGVQATTDATGAFQLVGAPSGAQVLDIDPSSAAPGPGGVSYAGFREAYTVLANVDNIVERPFYLPQIDPAGEAVIDPNVMTVVTNPNLGISLFVPPNTAKNPDGTDFTGTLSISLVPDGLAPAAMPPQYAPDPLITIQPVGVVFETPVAITFANVDGHVPGSEVDIYSLDPVLGQFGVVGLGVVSADGLRIETVSGGVRAADWHFNLPPNAIAGFRDEEAMDCPVESGSQTSISSGSLIVEHETPAYISQGLARNVRLVYTSNQAAPAPILTATTTISERAAVPSAVSMSIMAVGGVEAANEVFTNTSGLSETTDETFRQVAQFDGSSFGTGAYEINASFTSHYSFGKISAPTINTVLVNNQRGSSIGSGWSFGGLGRLVTTGKVAFFDGNGDGFDFGAGMPLNGTATDVVVDGRANIYGAGKTTPPAPQGGGGGVLPPVVDLEGNDIVVTVPQASGLVSGFTGGCVPVGPDGGLGCGPRTDVGSFAGISGLVYDGGTMPLIGVFIDDNIPVNPSPARINYSGIAHSQIDFQPELGQTFFVGDGRTTAGELQRFIAPPGATRLYLGFAETFGFDGGTPPGFYDDNSGALSVRVEVFTDGGGTGNARTFTTPERLFSTLVRNEDETFTMTAPNATVTQFDIDGRQTSQSDPNGNTTTWAYNAFGRLTSITDPVGRVTELAYSGNNLSTITDPAGRITSLSHDSDNNLIGITSPDGAQRAFTYDTTHRMSSQTSPRGYATLYDYDAFGRHRRSQWPDASEININPISTFGLPATGEGSAGSPLPVIRENEVLADFTDGESRTLEFEAEERGRIESLSDASGLNTNTQLNDNGQPTSASFPSGATTTSAYDGQGNRTSHSDSIFGTQSASIFEAPFNSRVSSTDTDGTTQYSYAGPNIASRTSQLGRVSSFTYDTRGNRLTSIGSDGVENRHSHDANDNTIDFRFGPISTERVTLTARTLEGYLESSTDAMGRVTSYSYDAHGRMLAQMLPDGRAITRTYDATGNLATITPAGRPAHRFTFGATNQLEQVEPPTVGPGNWATQFQYNQAQELAGIVRADGSTVAFAYDVAGRLASVSYPHDLVAFAYSITSGLLTTSTSQDGTLQVGYRGGLAEDLTFSYGLVSGTVSANHDSERRIDELHVAGTVPIAYTYDDDGDMVSAGALAIARDASSGRVTSSTLGTITDNWTFDAYSEVDHYDVGAGSETLFSYDLAYDAIGRISQNLETTSGESLTTVYGYDLAGRLETVTHNGLLVESYAYDTNDNRVSATTGSNSILATYDDQDRLLTYGEATYTYTRSGELATKTVASETTTYDYDALGNLRSVSLPDGTFLEYLVDGQNRRVGKKIDGALVRGWFYKDNLNPIAELDGAGNIVSLFVYATWTHVPDYMIRGGETYRIITDRRGSVRMVVDVATGATVAMRTYDSFGRIVAETNHDFQPFGFVGGLYDNDTGLTRLGDRDYDATIGRWTAKDPSLFVGGPNLYRYASDPINWIDVTGLFIKSTETPAAIALLALVGGGIVVTASNPRVRKDVQRAVAVCMLIFAAAESNPEPAPRREAEPIPVGPSTGPKKRNCHYVPGSFTLKRPTGFAGRLLRRSPNTGLLTCDCNCPGPRSSLPFVSIETDEIVDNPTSADEICEELCERL